MVGIAQNGKKRLIFIVVPQVRTTMKEMGKREKHTHMRMDKPKENTNIYASKYIHTATDIKAYKNTDTHIHINTSYVIQVR